ncbi:MAG TPA: excinuclease ABC subunit UvrC, partial [Candidatus Saccharimonadales bacterium]|nr:excinuclease ABC subunit UvrC [Candidatus Saccharimonadales bacterium]
MDDALREKIRGLPAQPGCYIFRNGAGEALYVGKALSLRDRVRSYAQDPSRLGVKIARMVSEAEDVEVILTGSEVEALILENNLVKKNLPRYNTMLRDDKNFPYLKMTVQDPFPRLALVRRARQDGSLYFGPYLPASNARRSTRMVARFFGVATCHERLDGSRPRPCLYYQLDQCQGPCAGLADPDEYRQAVRDAEMFLQGRNAPLVESLESRMKEASAAEAFERAAHYRDLVRTIRASMQRQHMASVGLEDQDFFDFHREGGQAAAQLFVMRQGLVQARREFSFEDLDESDPAFMAGILERYYGGDADVPAEVYAGREPEGRAVIEEWLSRRRGSRVRIKVPRRGVKRKFMEMVRRNARLAFEARFRAAHTHGAMVLEELQEILGLPEVPYRIEAFDISHIQGSETVASMVVWEGGRAKRSDYRRFRVKAVEGVDDYASMREVVGRRYVRIVREGRNLPDLILIDGGKGQLEAARRALDDAGIRPVPMAALAKKEELIFLPGRADPVRLERSSPVLHLVQRVRDEAHRFAVTYHRSLRARRTVASTLTAIPGVGEKTARKLLRVFGSVGGVRTAESGALEA